MENTHVQTESRLNYSFCFEAFGVPVTVRSNDRQLLDEAKHEVRRAFVGRAVISENGLQDPRQRFDVVRKDDGFSLIINDEHITQGPSRRLFLKYFSHRLRLAVTEHAESLVIIHAGVVGWKGRAIVLPAKSFHGKTTIVTELVRAGAEYYSDEYAVIDQNGLVHPFPRLLSVRGFDGEVPTEVDTPVEELGGKTGVEPIPIGMVVLTQFVEGGEWAPVRLTTGQGVLEIIPHTIPIRAAPAFCLKVLKEAMSRAIILRSPRGEASDVAHAVLNSF